jgi:predicted PurR-regulated permease PerM
MPIFSRRKKDKTVVIDLPNRTIVRSVLVVVGVILVLYAIWLLRTPLTWLFVASLLAIALTGPVGYFNRHMPRGLAILVVYVFLLAIPISLIAIAIPPSVQQGSELARHLPEYTDNVQEYVEHNDQLRGVEKQYNVVGNLQKQAGQLTGQADDVAGTVAGVGLGVVNSLAAFVTIVVMTTFMLLNGHRWLKSFLAYQNPQTAPRIDRALHRISRAVGNYVVGALGVAALAGVTSFIVMSILGVPFAAPLAILAGLLSLIPLVGATIGAVIIGIMTLFVHFPTTTIIWAVWAIAYQQVENTLIQPQIQKRAVHLSPFAVLVAVLFGATLFGILGAILAIPIAASIQIAGREWLEYRQHHHGTGEAQAKKAARALKAGAR